jgi:hypothetical protein
MALNIKISLPIVPIGFYSFTVEDSVGDGFDLKNGSFVEVYVNSVPVGNFHGNFGYSETIKIVPPGYIVQSTDKIDLKDIDSAAFRFVNSKGIAYAIEIILWIALMCSWFLYR